MPTDGAFEPDSAGRETVLVTDCMMPEDEDDLTRIELDRAAV